MFLVSVAGESAFTSAGFVVEVGISETVVFLVSATSVHLHFSGVVSAVVALLSGISEAVAVAFLVSTVGESVFASIRFLVLVESSETVATLVSVAEEFGFISAGVVTELVMSETVPFLASAVNVLESVLRLLVVSNFVLLPVIGSIVEVVVASFLGRVSIVVPGFSISKASISVVFIGNSVLLSTDNCLSFNNSGQMLIVSNSLGCMFFSGGGNDKCWQCFLTASFL
ncbi:MAG: hypothetical protein EAZ39_10720 [Oscillatoriales cyanobacterium]|nr:MAG: hypothetical protein EAZ39_10720 [Oscillatoriales cyanobacterium]